MVTYDLEKAAQVDLIGVETYPKVADFHNDLSVEYLLLGRWEEALGPAREAVRLLPKGLVLRGVLANIYTACGRFPEARATLEEVIGQGLESSTLHTQLYRIARLEDDQRAMEKHLGWLEQNGDKESLLRIAYATAILAGRLQRARESSEALVASLQNQGMSENAALQLTELAYCLALTGYSDAAVGLLERALTLSQTYLTCWWAALAFASAKDFAGADQLVERLAAELPEATPVHRMIIPAIRALELTEHADPRGALERLRTAERYELAGTGAAVLKAKGEALLSLGRGDEAAAAFQKILDHPGVFRADIEYPLAHIGMGRATASMGDKESARKHYQDFLALWKDADPDIPILKEARTEYEKLK